MKKGIKGSTRLGDQKTSKAKKKLCDVLDVILNSTCLKTKPPDIFFEDLANLPIPQFPSPGDFWLPESLRIRVGVVVGVQ